MNPLMIGLAAGGMALSAYGSFSAAGNAKQAAAINKAIAQDEIAINAQKRQQMELEARRSQLQNMRNAQRLRAQATAAAVNQGATKGSGLYGGLAEVTAQAGVNELGINQNLEIGRTIFGLTDAISDKKMQLADVQSQQATNQAWASLGGAVVSNAGTISNIFGGFGSGSSGGNYQGMPWSKNTGGLY